MASYNTVELADKRSGVVHEIEEVPQCQYMAKLADMCPREVHEMRRMFPC